MLSVARSSKEVLSLVAVFPAVFLPNPDVTLTAHLTRTSIVKQ